MNFTEYLLAVNAHLTFLTMKSLSDLSSNEIKIECIAEATEIIKELNDQIKEKEEFDRTSTPDSQVLPFQIEGSNQPKKKNRFWKV